MKLRAVLLAAAVAVIAPSVAAQGSQAVLGGGCAGRVPPVVSGPLTLGSVLVIESTGCVDSAGTSKFMLFGVALPQASRVPVLLMTSLQRYEVCDVAVLPTIVVADFSNATDAIPIPIPVDPIWAGFPLALQSYCIECGFAGCFPSLTPALEATLR